MRNGGDETGQAASGLLRCLQVTGSLGVEAPVAQAHRGQCLAASPPRIWLLLCFNQPQARHGAGLWLAQLAQKPASNSVRRDSHIAVCYWADLRLAMAPSLFAHYPLYPSRAYILAIWCCWPFSVTGRLVLLAV